MKPKSELSGLRSLRNYISAWRCICGTYCFPGHICHDCRHDNTEDPQAHYREIERQDKNNEHYGK